MFLVLNKKKQTIQKKMNNTTLTTPQNDNSLNMTLNNNIFQALMLLNFGITSAIYNENANPVINFNNNKNYKKNNKKYNKKNNKYKKNKSIKYKNRAPRMRNHGRKR